MELCSCTRYIFESCPPKNSNIEKKKKNWDEKRGNDCALAILAMEGDRGTRAISCERVVQASILLDETRVVRVPLQHTRMHRKRENENQETGECLSDDKSIHILLLNSSVRENTRYSRKNASELHKSSLVFFLFVCFFFPLSFGHVHGKISRYSWCTMSLRSVFRDRKSGVYISV